MLFVAPAPFKHSGAIAHLDLGLAMFSCARLDPDYLCEQSVASGKKQLSWIQKRGRSGAKACSGEATSDMVRVVRTFVCTAADVACGAQP